MKTIIGEVYKELIIENSVFCAFAKHIDSIDEANKYLEHVKTVKEKANHYPYAYVLDNFTVQKASDDKEPQKTAGHPIIDVLIKNDITNAIIIVARYFGGKKLGAGGLTRAYSDAVALAIANASFGYLTEVSIIDFEVGYQHINNVNKFFKDKQLTIETTFNENAHFIIKIPTNILNESKEFLVSLTAGSVNFINISSFKEFI